MKLTILVHIIGVILFAWGAIWGIANYINFLVKDIPMEDWQFINFIVVGILIIIVNFFVTIERFKQNKF